MNNESAVVVDVACRLRTFIILTTASGVLMFALLMLALASGFWLSVLLAAWTAGPVAMLSTAYLFERRARGGTFGRVAVHVFDLKKGPWSFIIGDSIVLPAALLVACDAWTTHQVDHNAWFAVFSMMIGLAIGCNFHFNQDAKVYAKHGYNKHLDAPTKLVHDLAVTPALFAILFYAFIGMVIHAIGDGDLSLQIVVMVAVVLVWFGLAQRDGKKNKLPWGHPATRYRS